MPSSYFSAVIKVWDAASEHSQWMLVMSLVASVSSSPDLVVSVALQPWRAITPQNCLTLLRAGHSPGSPENEEVFNMFCGFCLSHIQDRKTRARA